jgi:hypothetical protein
VRAVSIADGAEKPENQTAPGDRAPSSAGAAGRAFAWFRARVLWVVPRAFSFIGLLAVALVVYVGFFRPAPGPSADPDDLANEWNATVAQLGVSPVFPPQEDLHVGDLFAVLGEGAADERLTLKASRAIKLDHLANADALLKDVYTRVIVMPKTPDSLPPSPDKISQPECDTGCFETVQVRELPLVVFPTIKSSRAEQAGLRVGLFDMIGAALFGSTHGESEEVGISIPYVESYGLGSLQASGILNTYCADVGRANLCDENKIREQLYMIVGRKAWEKIKGTDLYRYPVYLAFISSVYLARTINYTFSSDSSTAIKAQVYKKIEERLKSDATAAHASGSVPAGSPGGAGTVPDTQEQRLLEAERIRLLGIVGEASGLPAGISVDVETLTSNEVVISPTLPRPVVIGVIPILKDYRLDKGRSSVVEPE